MAGTGPARNRGIAWGRGTPSEKAPDEVTSRAGTPARAPAAEVIKVYHPVLLDHKHLENRVKSSFYKAEHSAHREVRYSENAVKYLLSLFSHGLFF